MNFRKFRQDLLRSLGNFIIYRLTLVVCKTLKISIRNQQVINDFYKNRNNFVLAFWHGTMTVPWYIHRNKNFVAMVSRSKDGGLLEKVLTPFNYYLVRGSSRNGGSAALGSAIDHALNNKSIAITPDGPTGPEKVFKAGAVVTAKKTGIPLVLLGVGYKNKVQFKSWDKFQAPKPFSKVNLIYSDPIYIDKNLSRDETTTIIKECEGQLNQLQNEAEIF